MKLAHVEEPSDRERRAHRAAERMCAENARPLTSSVTCVSPVRCPINDDRPGLQPEAA